MIKNYIIITVAILFGVILSGCQSESASTTAQSINHEKVRDSTEPKIVFAAAEYDFGKIETGSENTCVFSFINDGGKDLIIEKIHPTCGCTTTTINNMTIGPGQASEIEVVYHVGAAGKSKKRITIYTNDPENPQISLCKTGDRHPF